MSGVSYKRDVTGIDWKALKAALAEDDFDNGRTPEQLRASFERSYAVCFAVVGERVVGKARVISDGVCNAYMVDVWTHRPFRRRGIASEMIRQLLGDLPGQHVYLQADDDVALFYEHLGFRPQPNGLSLVVGKWLQRE
jgi:ribosomal protein S18 acetylase RimI-like enzyme